MKSYDKFPLSTVVYNAVTLGGALIVGASIVAQFGSGWLTGYLLLLLFTMGGVLASVCARCGYYGRRCGLGLGKVATLVAKKGQEDEYLRTPFQLLVALLLVLLMVLPVAGGVILLVNGSSAWRWIQLATVVGLLLAGIVPHPQLVCGHCRQGECGACPVGKRFWKSG
ncbi:MAG: hypothetical protein JXA14_27835 [Anaerolineae bacterium]|nr:hypothetical protein [Anaerolineae bacterium]